MNVQVVTNPTREAWNRFVASQPGASVYQSYEWGDIRRTQGWMPHYAAITEGDTWVAASLVLAKRLPGGLGSVLYSPRGPITTPDGGGALPALVAVVREIAEPIGGIFWRIEPPVRAHDGVAARGFACAGFRRLSQEWSYWNRPKYDMHLSVSDGEAAVFSRISSRTRGKIRYAPKQGVIVETGYGDRDVESFYRLMTNTARKKRIPVRGLDYFSTLYWTLEKAGMGRLFLARRGDQPVAAGLSSRFGRLASLLYLSNDYSVKYAGWAVQWEMLRWAISEGCAVYDFAGTGTSYPPRKADKGYGVYQFKKSFGAEIIAWYGYADYVFRPVRYGWFRAIEQSLPYGERVFLDWPKSLLYRWQASIARGDDAAHKTRGRSSGDQP